MGVPAHRPVSRAQVCSAHSSYATCTNERREDCHWTFLPGTRMGLCRVEPVSKCLATGECVCKTEDFQGGGAGLGGGLVFHVPISVTARDISAHAASVSYSETFTMPAESEQDAAHPLNESFFISRADFTARLLEYGCSVNAKDYDGSTALHSAAEVGSVEAASVLLDCGAELHAANNYLDGLASSTRFGVARTCTCLHVGSVAEQGAGAG